MTQRTYVVSGWLFLRLVGVAYAIALVSLWVQVNGLFGPDGILPAAPFLQTAQEHFGIARWWNVPTLGWLSASQSFVHGLCGLGVLCALCVIFGVMPALCLFVLWVVYLSLVTIGQDFMVFQGDGLLLEIGFLALLLAPLQTRTTLERAGALPRVVLWLLRWLLFRLMFASGVAQLIHGDPAWRTLRALTTYYETQPLPTWIGWYAYQLPLWVHQAAAATMLGIELLLPFCICIPGRLQYVACGGFVLLQGLLAATGNYGLLNVLTVVLCLLLLDDAVWIRRWQNRLLIESGVLRPRTWPLWVVGPLAVLIAVVSVMQMGRTFGFRGEWPQPLGQLARLVAPFRTVNAYGPLVPTTTTRREILIQGSNDGQAWHTFEFRWKPGEPTRRPSFVAPHQPRLDWQMWFVALGDVHQTPWFGRFLNRLLEGSPPVLALLRHNPFPDGPPRYIRAALYEYRFTNVAMRHREHTWWQRKWLQLYAPARSRRHNTS